MIRAISLWVKHGGFLLSSEIVLRPSVLRIIYALLYLCPGHLTRQLGGRTNQEHKTLHQGFRLSSLAFSLYKRRYSRLAAWSNDDNFAAGTLTRSTAIAVRTTASTRTGLSNGIYKQCAVSYRGKKRVIHKRLVSLVFELKTWNLSPGLSVRSAGIHWIKIEQEDPQSGLAAVSMYDWLLAGALPCTTAGGGVTSAPTGTWIGLRIDQICTKNYRVKKCDKHNGLPCLFWLG